MAGEVRGAPRERAERGAAAVDSRLRSVFLQHRLIARLQPLPGVPLPAAKFVVERVVERLLAVSGGIEPLMLLEKDGQGLADHTAIAVLTVVLARAAGWPAESVADLGAAALLAAIGPRTAAGDGGRTGSRWLLARGAEDFWLRCALVARHAGEASGGALPRHGCGGVAFVRLAVAVHAAMRSAPGGDWLAALRAAGVVEQPELLDLVPAALARS